MYSVVLLMAMTSGADAYLNHWESALLGGSCSGCPVRWGPRAATVLVTAVLFGGHRESCHGSGLFGRPIAATVVFGHESCHGGGLFGGP